MFFSSSSASLVVIAGGSVSQLHLDDSSPTFLQSFSALAGQHFFPSFARLDAASAALLCPTVCEVHIVSSEPSPATQTPALSSAASAQLKVDRAKKLLADATASLAVLEAKPFPWKEAKTDEGVSYFYDESSEESVYKLPPEDAAIYFEKKRLLKVIQSAQKLIASASKLLGRPSDDATAEVTGAEGSGDKIAGGKGNSKLPPHMQKAKRKTTSEIVTKKEGAESVDGDGKESEGAIRLQKVELPRMKVTFAFFRTNAMCRFIFWKHLQQRRSLAASNPHRLSDSSYLSSESTRPAIRASAPSSPGFTAILFLTFSLVTFVL
jgi:hypothetical protein